ncbi:hypothetical protein CUJ83_00390 [Methanocella sp. CWC-04]|uniref:Uncharacterized protein n=1 Tax=Methanooceanicella nereidis TaxID=2052831 RepID=A0AAP2W5T8_9EURY|nr:hypothetical protein [Methanocella sp. CWC-04]MCD1293456.1 hypothetical protein [Methanocella sp. CWC-04]
MSSGSVGDIKEKVIEFLHSKKGHIADIEEVTGFLESMSLTKEDAISNLKEISEEGAVSISGDSVFLNSDTYLPRVRCLICDGTVKRDELVPFYRERYYPFVNWGFHRSCLEGGALEEMLGSGMFRIEDGNIFPAYEYGEGRGKNPITIAIKYLRSDEFLYTLELKSADKK